MKRHSETTAWQQRTAVTDHWRQQGTGIVYRAAAPQGLNNHSAAQALVARLRGDSEAGVWSLLEDMYEQGIDTLAFNGVTLSQAEVERLARGLVAVGARAPQWRYLELHDAQLGIFGCLLPALKACMRASADAGEPWSLLGIDLGGMKVVDKGVPGNLPDEQLSDLIALIGLCPDLEELSLDGHLRLGDGHGLLAALCAALQTTNVRQLSLAACGLQDMAPLCDLIISRASDDQEDRLDRLVLGHNPQLLAGHRRMLKALAQLPLEERPTLQWPGDTVNLRDQVLGDAECQAMVDLWADDPELARAVTRVDLSNARFSTPDGFLCWHRLASQGRLALVGDCGCLSTPRGMALDAVTASELCAPAAHAQLTQAVLQQDGPQLLQALQRLLALGHRSLSLKWLRGSVTNRSTFTTFAIHFLRAHGGLLCEGGFDDVQLNDVLMDKEQWCALFRALRAWASVSGIRRVRFGPTIGDQNFDCLSETLTHAVVDWVGSLPRLEELALQRLDFSNASIARLNRCLQTSRLASLSVSNIYVPPGDIASWTALLAPRGNGARLARFDMRGADGFASSRHQLQLLRSLSTQESGPDIVWPEVDLDLRQLSLSDEDVRAVATALQRHPGILKHVAELSLLDSTLPDLKPVLHALAAQEGASIVTLNLNGVTRGGAPPENGLDIDTLGVVADTVRQMPRLECLYVRDQPAWLHGSDESALWGLLLALMNTRVKKLGLGSGTLNLGVHERLGDLQLSVLVQGLQLLEQRPGGGLTAFRFWGDLRKDQYGALCHGLVAGAGVPSLQRLDLSVDDRVTPAQVQDWLSAIRQMPRLRELGGLWLSCEPLSREKRHLAPLRNHFEDIAREGRMRTLQLCVQQHFGPQFLPPGMFGHIRGHLRQIESGPDEV